MNVTPGQKLIPTEFPRDATSTRRATELWNRSLVGLAGLVLWLECTLHWPTDWPARAQPRNRNSARIKHSDSTVVQFRRIGHPTLANALNATRTSYSL